MSSVVGQLEREKGLLLSHNMLIKSLHLVIPRLQMQSVTPTVHVVEETRCVLFISVLSFFFWTIIQ